MISIIETFRNSASETFIHQASDMFGESIEHVRSTVDDAFPALLGTLVLKGRTESGSANILEYLSANNIGGIVLKDLPGLLNSGPEFEVLKANGGDILNYLLDEKVSPLIDSIASHNTLRTSSASSILKILATILMTELARIASEENLDPAGVRRLLTAQTPEVMRDTPENLKDFLGLTSISTIEKSASGSLEGAPQIDPEPDRSLFSKLLPWIVLLIASLGLFYFLEKGSEVPPGDLDRDGMDPIEMPADPDTL